MRKTFCTILIILLLTACGQSGAEPSQEPEPLPAEPVVQTGPPAEPEQAGDAANLQISGIFEYANGLFYSSEHLYDAGDFCLVSESGLTALPTNTVEFTCSFMGADFDISFAWAEYGGQLYLCNLGGYDAVYGLKPIPDRTDSVMVFLYAEENGRYICHGFALDLRSLEMTDFTDGLQIEGAYADGWHFNPGMSRAISSVNTENGYDDILWDLESRTGRSVSEIAGVRLSDPAFVTNDKIRAYCFSGEGDFVIFDLVTGELSSLTGTAGTVTSFLDDIGCWWRDGGCVLRMVYSGDEASGRWAIRLDEGSGETSLLDFTDGSLTPLSLPENLEITRADESPSGNRIALSLRQRSEEYSEEITTLAVLDISDGSVELIPLKPDSRTGSVMGWSGEEYIVLSAGNHSYDLYFCAAD